MGTIYINNKKCDDIKVTITWREYTEEEKEAEYKRQVAIHQKGSRRSGFEHDTGYIKTKYCCGKPFMSIGG